MKEILLKNKYRFLAIIGALFYYIMAGRPTANLVLFIASLIFMLAITYTNFDLLLTVKSKNKTVYISFITTTFIAYLFEAAFSSSFYLSDMVVQNYYISVLLFVIRFLYFLSSIMVLYHLLDLGKRKYIFVPLINMLFGIYLYIEVITFLIPPTYIIQLIIFIVIENMENKK